MKLTELMVGDYVKDKKTNKCLRITGTDILLFHDYYEPIHLTKEILVKNGFEYAYNEVSKMKNRQLLVANIGGHYIEVRLDKKNVAIWYDYDENGDCVYSDVLIDLPHHVHNFQHLLRLCVIDKEIEL